ncbi:MAG: enoyl-CoA hydratase-related protein, partial [Rickettsiales bacterium]
FMSGERFGAADAMRMGLVHEVAEDLKDRAEAVVASFLKAGPIAAREAKRLIRDVLYLSGQADQLKLHTSEVIAGLRISDEGQEGISALLDKRKPSWQS